MKEKEKRSRMTPAKKNLRLLLEIGTDEPTLASKRGGSNAWKGKVELFDLFE